LAPQTGVRTSLQSAFVMQPTQRPAGPQRGVAALRFLQPTSSVPTVQVRHDKLAASQIGAVSLVQLVTVRQVPSAPGSVQATPSESASQSTCRVKRKLFSM
jgi:hypothetical protein